MPTIAATVSDEDIRRQYYETAGYSMWITQMQLDPLQLIVCDDATGQYYRVPVTLSKGEPVFADAVEVNVQYVDSSSGKKASAIVWASRSDSLDGIAAPAGAGKQLVDLEALRSQVDYEALSRMVTEDSRVSPAGLKVSPAQAAAIMHAASLRADQRAKSPDADPAAGPSQTEGAVNMPFDRVKIREALGLGSDATDAQLQEAWAAAFAPPAAPPTPAPPPPTEPGPTSSPAPPGSPADTASLTTLAEMAKAMGVTLIDPAQLTTMQTMAAQGQMAYEKQRRDERDQVIDLALKAGKIEVARVPAWKQKWDADPEGARATLDALAPNMVPMEARGYAGTVASNEAEAALFDLYPEEKAKAGGRRG